MPRSIFWFERMMYCASAIIVALSLVNVVRGEQHTTHLSAAAEAALKAPTAAPTVDAGSVDAGLLCGGRTASDVYLEAYQGEGRSLYATA